MQNQATPSTWLLSWSSKNVALVAVITADFQSTQRK